MVKIWVRNSQGARELVELAEQVSVEAQAIKEKLPKASVVRCSVAVFGLTASDIHNNGSEVKLVDKMVEAGWSRAANIVTYTGGPTFVKGYVSINAENKGGSYWSRTKLRVRRGVETIAVLDDLSMLQNAAYDGDATISGVFFDANPGQSPSYTFEWFDQDNRSANMQPRPYSQISVEAHVRVDVLTK